MTRESEVSRPLSGDIPSGRLLGVLHRAGLRVGDLQAMSDVELLKVPGIGPTLLHEARTCRKADGLAAWLYMRYGRDATPWADLPVATQCDWRQEADLVRGEVDRVAIRVRR